MKTFITILIVILLPILALTQSRNVPSVSLKTLNGKSVLASNVIQEDELTLVYFFNEYSRDLTDNFDYLENLTKNNNSKIKIIAIYNASNGTYGQLKPFLNGNAIEVETYIDINGEFQRAMGLSSISALVLYGGNQEVPSRYSESVAYSNEFSDLQFSALLCNCNSNSDNRPSLGINISGE